MVELLLLLFLLLDDDDLSASSWALIWAATLAAFSMGVAGSTMANSSPP